jgi:hypothetical protein
MKAVIMRIHNFLLSCGLFAKTRDP